VVWIQETDKFIGHVLDIAGEGGETWRKRIFCYILLDKLSADGIDEAFEALTSIFRFYLPTEPKEVEPLPLPRSINLVLRPAVQRPEFPSIED